MRRVADRVFYRDGPGEVAGPVVCAGAAVGAVAGACVAGVAAAGLAERRMWAAAGGAGKIAESMGAGSSRRRRKSVFAVGRGRVSVVPV